MSNERDLEVEPETVTKRAPTDAALRKRKQRARDKAKQEADNSEDRKSYWEKNRSTLPPETLSKLVAQDEVIQNLLAKMELADVETLEDDEEFYRIEDVVKEVIDSVKTFGVTHSGYIRKTADIPAGWFSERYWSNPQLLEKLVGEGEATAAYIKTGLLQALPDTTTIAFLQKAGWTWPKAADLVGYKLTSDNKVCYGRGQTFLEAWPNALTLDKEGCPRDYHTTLVSGKELKRR